MWSVLTDYDRLTDYVPNLDVCKRLKGGTKTRYRLKQAGCSQSLFLRMEAQAVLDVQEVERTMGRKELRFSMIESENFKVRTPFILDSRINSFAVALYRSIFSLNDFCITSHEGCSHSSKQPTIMPMTPLTQCLWSLAGVLWPVGC